MAALTEFQILHYQWMLLNMDLNPRHRAWIIDQLTEAEAK